MDTTQISQSPVKSGSASPNAKPAARCSFCGMETTLPGIFRKVPRSFSTGIDSCCPPCWEKRLKWRSLWGVLVIPLYAVIGFAALTFLPDKHYGFLSLNLALLFTLAIASTIPHELAHALAAHCAGLRVFKIFLGDGRTWLRRTIRGVDVELKIRPTSGVVVAGHREIRGYRWRQFLFILAGPAANVALVVLACAGMGFQFSAISSARWGLVQGIDGWMALACANCYLLLTNLWPRMIRTAVGLASSDGRNLFRALFAKPELARASHAAWFRLEAAASDQSGRTAECLQWLERGLALYPENDGLLQLMGLRRLNSGEVLASRQILVRLLIRMPPQSPARAISLNNIAFADALIGGGKLLSEADRYSAQALAGLPWLRCVQNTRGTVLLFLGRLDEALTLLRSSAEDPKTDPGGAAQCQCLLAIAEAFCGNLTAAAQHREQAYRAEPECYLLPRADAAIRGEELPPALGDLAGQNLELAADEDPVSVE